MDYIFGNNNNNNNNNEECSSGCDSGWTSYLEHSSDSQTEHYFSGVRRGHQLGFSEVKRLVEHQVIMSEEDMSMVSDASSGPAHYNNIHHADQEENHHTNNNKNMCNFCDFASVNEEDSCNSRKKKKGKEKRRRKVVVQDRHSSLLDDTASSPCLDDMDFSNERYGVSSRSCRMFEENNVSEYSQGGYSTTHYKVRPEHRVVHYDHFKSSPSGNIHLEQNQWF